MVYSLDHPPAHVHLVGPDGRAKIRLNCPGGPLQVEFVIGIEGKAMRRLLDAMRPRIAELCRGWERIHGY